MAEGEGFEPSLQITPDYLVSNETPSTTWVTLRVFILSHFYCFYKITCYNVLMEKSKELVSWEAAEYIKRSKNAWWYLGLFVVGAGLCALSVYFKQWTFLVLVIVCVVAICVTNLRPPRKIHYALNKSGLVEGDRLHKYDDFRAFGILKEGSQFSAILIPKKRFALSVKVYFPEANGEAIVDALGARLPMEDVKLDLLDKIVNFLHI